MRLFFAKKPSVVLVTTAKTKSMKNKNLVNKDVSNSEFCIRLHWQISENSVFEVPHCELSIVIRKLIQCLETLILNWLALTWAPNSTKIPIWRESELWAKTNMGIDLLHSRSPHRTFWKWSLHLHSLYLDIRVKFRTLRSVISM